MYCGKVRCKLANATGMGFSNGKDSLERGVWTVKETKVAKDENDHG